MCLYCNTAEEALHCLYYLWPVVFTRTMHKNHKVPQQNTTCGFDLATEMRIEELRSHLLDPIFSHLYTFIFLEGKKGLAF